MQKRISIALISAVLLINLCSCNYYSEIENMDIMTTIFADKADADIKLGGGIARVRRLGGEMGDEPIGLVYGQGNTFENAHESLINHADHKLYYGAVRAVVVSQDYGKDGINELIYHFKNDAHSRLSVQMFTTDSDPSEIVKFTPLNDFSGGFSAENMLDTLQSTGRGVSRTIGDVCESLSYRQVGFAVPNIHITDDMLGVDGYSIFDGDKIIYKIPLEQSDCISFILSKNAKKKYYLGNKQFIGELSKSNRKVSVVEHDGKLKIKLTVDADMTVNRTDAIENFSVALPELTYEAQEKLQNDISNLCEIEKSLGCDFLEFYRYYMIKHRSNFDNINWNEMIKNADIEVICSVKISENQKSVNE